jgi:hypothetical protein
MAISQNETVLRARVLVHFERQGKLFDVSVLITSKFSEFQEMYNILENHQFGHSSHLRLQQLCKLIGSLKIHNNNNI